jgi:hypothetical protein
MRGQRAYHRSPGPRDARLRSAANGTGHGRASTAWWPSGPSANLAGDSWLGNVGTCGWDTENRFLDSAMPAWPGCTSL